MGREREGRWTRWTKQDFAEPKPSWAKRLAILPCPLPPLTSSEAEPACSCRCPRYQFDLINVVDQHVVLHPSTGLDLVLWVSTFALQFLLARPCRCPLAVSIFALAKVI